MMVVHCDRWLGEQTEIRRRVGLVDDRCQGEIPAGGSYYTLRVGDREGRPLFQATGGRLHFCRTCMQAAVAELAAREDMGLIEVHRVSSYY